MDKETREFLENMYNHINMRFDNISVQVKENTDMLKGLEENAKVTRAEIEKIANDVVHMKGDIEALRKDISNVEIITSSNWADIAKLKAVK
jgi:archaellum component FlaC